MNYSNAFCVIQKIYQVYGNRLGRCRKKIMMVGRHSNPKKLSKPKDGVKNQPKKSTVRKPNGT
jgi:hypothetical protein